MPDPHSGPTIHDRTTVLKHRFGTQVPDGAKPTDRYHLAAPINEYVAKDIGDKIMQRLQDAGLHTTQDFGALKVLGHGQMGLALAVGDRVLKITTDDTEAQASAQAMKLKPPSDVLTQYDDVFRFKNAGKTTDLYGIVQEKLLPPQRDWAEFSNQWYRYRYQGFQKFDDEKRQYDAGPEYDAAERTFETPITADNVAAFTAWLRDVEYRNVEGAYKAKLEWLAHVADELARAGIEYRDLKSNNLMRRSNGQHVIIDLGVSRSSGSSDIETVARLAALMDVLAGRLQDRT